MICLEFKISSLVFNKMLRDEAFYFLAFDKRIGCASNLEVDMTTG